jgi:acetyl esterase/lipase
MKGVSMRKDVTIPSCGSELAGWLYVPDGLGKKERRPAIVMAHGLSAVKEMYLDAFAERFCAAGFVVTVFDYRNQGASPGEPRGQIFPDDQHDDYRNAITWTQARAEVDAERIGIWGSSYSGGHVIHVSAFDRRVKCAACQVPLVDGLENTRRLVRADVHPQFRALLNQERAARATDPAKVSYFPVVSEDCEGCVLPTPDSWEWFSTTGKNRAPNWKNEMTWESVEKLIEYRPGAHIHLISPTPFPDGRGERRRPDADGSRHRGIPAGSRAQEARRHPRWALRRLPRASHRGLGRSGDRVVPRASHELSTSAVPARGDGTANVGRAFAVSLPLWEGLSATMRGHGLPSR